LRRVPRHLRLPSRNVSGPPIPQPNIFPDCSRAQRGRSGRFPARPSPPAAAEPYRVVLLAFLTSPESGFMLVSGGGMGNRHEIRYASGRRRKANSYPFFRSAELYGSVNLAWGGSLTLFPKKIYSK
jgi:hypothetical protein